MENETQQIISNQDKQSQYNNVVKEALFTNNMDVKRISSLTNLIIGDSRKVLSEIPDNTFQCCITSPPYWGLRDYGIEGQIGAENIINDYIEDLVSIFSEVRRTLKDDGTPIKSLGLSPVGVGGL
ncbi:hypothetical protein ES708_10927 [subsurface metagenome]